MVENCGIFGVSLELLWGEIFACLVELLDFVVDVFLIEVKVGFCCGFVEGQSWVVYVLCSVMLVLGIAINYCQISVSLSRHLIYFIARLQNSCKIRVFRVEVVE